MTFGDLYDEQSAVTHLAHGNARAVRLLESLGTEPAVYYLKGGESNVGDE
jgi:hypothetical protein